MRNSQSNERRRKGFAIILTALMLTFIIPLVGIGIDGGVMYSARAKLQASADAAALGAARALAVGQTISEQAASAQLRAQGYFAANFPPGSLDTTNPSVSVNVYEVGLHVRRVTVNAEVEAPLYFMRYMGLGQGGGNPVVRVIGEASRRDVNLMMVIDRSGSLQNAGACDDLESASQSFVSMFANQRDRLGLITFGGSYRYDYALTKTFKQSPTLYDQLGLIYPGGCAGWTGSSQAFWNAYIQLANLNEPGALNAILFFTDGRPNTVTAQWTLDTIGTPGNSNMTRCYDWEHGKSYSQYGYDPSNLTYTGYIATETNSDGVRGHLAGTMPANDPGKVTIPDGYSGSAKSSGSDCWWRRSNTNYVRRDVPFYPNQDMYGNSFFGWKGVTTFSSSSPYAGKINYASGSTGLNAAINAIDNAALRVRNKELAPTVDVLVYSIGLGDLGPDQAELLQRIANDRGSPIFDDTKPEGLYVFAPNPAALNEAFVRIASEILRYSI